MSLNSLIEFVKIVVIMMGNKSLREKKIDK
jgi:hypothetical protein